MEATFKFILRPGLKSVYCVNLDKHIYQDGIETNDQKVIGELCLTPGVFLIGSNAHAKMLKDTVKQEAFRKEQAVRDAEKMAREKAQEEVEKGNMAKSETAYREAVKPTGAEKARVDEIRQSLEKEIADKKDLKAASRTYNKKDKRK